MVYTFFWTADDVQIIISEMFRSEADSGVNTEMHLRTSSDSYL